MRVLTVRLPWAWAIVHGGKDVENRVRNVAGSYRGPVAIHAGLADDSDASPGLWYDRARHTYEAQGLTFGDSRVVWRDRGAIIGVVDLVDVHDVGECIWVGPAVEDFDGNFVSQEVTTCSEWAEDGNVYHLVLANARPLAEPIPFRGALGLRTLPADVEAAVLAGVA